MFKRKRGIDDPLTQENNAIDRLLDRTGPWLNRDGIIWRTVAKVERVSPNRIEVRVQPENETPFESLSAASVYDVIRNSTLTDHYTVAEVLIRLAFGEVTFVLKRDHHQQPQQQPSPVWERISHARLPPILRLRGVNLFNADQIREAVEKASGTDPKHVYLDFENKEVRVQSPFTLDG